MMEEMIVYDSEFNIIDNPDLEKGYVDTREMNVSHKWIVDSEEEGHYEVIQEYPNGGKDVEWVIDVPEVGHWETRNRDTEEIIENYKGPIDDDWAHDVETNDTFQYLLYTPYTAEEFEQIAKDKAESERLAQIADYKQKLANTDYILTKMVEYNVSGTDMPEDDAARYADIISQRAQWRAEINRLESEAVEDA